MFANSLFRSSPFEDLWRLQHELDEMLGASRAPGASGSVPRGAFPAVNVEPSADKVDVYLFAPGIEPQGLAVRIQQNLLTVSGERRAAASDGASPYRRERFKGTFQRTITLPEDVNPEASEARYRDGVLHISVQRRAAAKPRQIEVESA